MRSFLPALWHLNGAGIGFPQRSCKAEARYIAQVLPSELRHEVIELVNNAPKGGIRVNDGGQLQVFT